MDLFFRFRALRLSRCLVLLVIGWFIVVGVVAMGMKPSPLGVSLGASGRRCGWRSCRSDRSTLIGLRKRARSTLCGRRFVTGRFLFPGSWSERFRLSVRQGTFQHLRLELPVG